MAKRRSLQAGTSSGANLPRPLRHLILFLACVVLPALFTTAAPVSVIQFDREPDGTVSARVSTRCLFVIPFRRVRVDDVVSVSGWRNEGSLNRTGFSGSRRSVQSEDSAFLAIEGRNTAAEIEVSSASINRVLARSHAFLDNAAERHLRLIVIANWKFGLLAGGFLSLLTVLYLACVVHYSYLSLRRSFGGGRLPVRE
jgi:hypothetical protein